MKNLNYVLVFSSVFLVFVSIVGYGELQSAKKKSEWAILNIEGSEEIEVDADTAHFTISIREQGEIEENLAKSVKNKTNKVVKILTENNIPETDIETSYLDSSDQYYNYSLEKPKQQSYVNNTIRIKTTSIDDIQNVFEEITQIKGVSFNGLYYELTDIEKEKDKLAAKATENAREKADAMAKSLGVKIKGIHSVRTDDGDYGSQPYHRGAEAGSSSGGGLFSAAITSDSSESQADNGMPLFKKKITIRSTVFVDFFIH